MTINNMEETKRLVKKFVDLTQGNNIGDVIDALTIFTIIFHKEMLVDIMSIEEFLNYFKMNIEKNYQFVTQNIDAIKKNKNGDKNDN